MHTQGSSSSSQDAPAGLQVFVGLLGLVAVPIVAYSLYTLSTTGAGLPLPWPAPAPQGSQTVQCFHVPGNDLLTMLAVLGQNVHICSQDVT